MEYTKEWVKEYNKTWYWGISRSKPWPENLISGRPIRLFGIFLFFLLKLAKKNYQWNKLD